MTRYRLALLCVLAAAAPAPAVPPVRNADFEAGQPGQPPPGWALREVAAAQGFTAQLADRDPAGGRLALELARPEARTFGQYATVSQLVPATELRGKRVRFSAAVRTSGLTGYAGAGLYARVRRPDYRHGHCAEMNDRPERGKAWGRRSVVVDVAADAEAVEFGFALHMAGTAWFDDAALEVLGPAGVGNDPPAPLADRGRANVEAFARLLAYVRFFHPSDEAAAADWGRFAVGHVGFAEVARSPEELAARLTELLAPVAPTVRVFVTARPPAAAPDLAAPAEAAVRVVGWRHVGADPNGLHGRYKHERVTDRDLPGASPLRWSADVLPRPADVYEADLGGGVSCRVPVALCADAGGTLPRAAAKGPAPAKPADFPPTGDDRATRLAGVCLAWGAFQHFYPYFEEAKADWPAALREALDAAATDPDAAAFNRTVRRLVARLEDSHGAVRPGSAAPRADGALPLAWDVVEGKLAVTWVDPAAKLRVRVGDVVEAIDGTPAADAVAAAAKLASGATPGHRRYRTCADLRAGPAGQPVALGFRTPAGEAYRLTLARAPADDGALRGPSMREPRLAPFARPAAGVAYLDLDRLTDADFLPAFAQARQGGRDRVRRPRVPAGADVVPPLADRQAVGGGPVQRRAHPGPGLQAGGARRVQAAGRAAAAGVEGEGGVRDRRAGGELHGDGAGDCGQHPDGGGRGGADGGEQRRGGPVRAAGRDAGVVDGAEGGAAGRAAAARGRRPPDGAGGADAPGAGGGPGRGARPGGRAGPPAGVRGYELNDSPCTVIGAVPAADPGHGPARPGAMLRTAGWGRVGRLRQSGEPLVQLDALRAEGREAVRHEKLTQLDAGVGAVVMHLVPQPPEEPDGSADRSLTNPPRPGQLKRPRPGEQHVQHEQAAERVPEQRLPLAVDRVPLLDHRLEFGLDEREELVVAPGLRDRPALGELALPRGRGGRGQVERPPLLVRPHVVRRVPDPDHDRGQVGPGLAAHRRMQDREVAVAVRQVDDRVAAGRGRALRRGSGDPIHAAGF